MSDEPQIEQIEQIEQGETPVAASQPESTSPAGQPSIDSSPTIEPGPLSTGETAAEPKDDRPGNFRLHATREVELPRSYQGGDPKTTPQPAPQDNADIADDDVAICPICQYRFPARPIL